MTLPNKIVISGKEYKQEGQSIPNPVPLPEKQFAKLLPDTKLKEWKFMCRSLTYPDDKLKDDKGYPQMMPFVPRVGTKLNAQWQWWMMQQQLYYMFGHTEWDRLSRAYKTKMTTWFNNMFDDHRFLTNGAGVNIAYNAITGERKGGSLPIAWEVACAVNVVELVSTRIIAKYGRFFYEVKTLDGSKNPPPIISSNPNVQKYNHITTPQFIHVAVTWAFNEKTGKHLTEDFPQLANVGLSGHSLYPFISPQGKVLIEIDKVKLLNVGESVYVNHFEF